LRFVRATSIRHAALAGEVAAIQAVEPVPDVDRVKSGTGVSRDGIAAGLAGESDRRQSQARWCS